LERFFPQVVANAHGLKALRRRRLGERLSEQVEELVRGEFLAQDLQGEDSEEGRLERGGEAEHACGPATKGLDRAEMLEDAGSGLMTNGIVGEFDPLAISMSPDGDLAVGLVGRHAYYDSMLISKRFGPYPTPISVRNSGGDGHLPLTRC
jgi:hypothetical protein